jgi:hypothetical protein
MHGVRRHRQGVAGNWRRLSEVRAGRNRKARSKAAGTRERRMSVASGVRREVGRARGARSAARRHRCWSALTNTAYRVPVGRAIFAAPAVAGVPTALQACFAPRLPSRCTRFWRGGVQRLMRFTAGQETCRDARALAAVNPSHALPPGFILD